ncbi:guided entry of tail-anchored proteins factor 1-like [Neocloeon triangulifer]|uniref:guided entry of tail-anchored proteins factor 1-like n=1 Tax=Neocloeon triangulifer TaxID=2078957 RepID=UPI00286F5962|nr:guided entry of tail-anchored proteins factor 1-like [Neocloeon triangulifer]
MENLENISLVVKLIIFSFCSAFLPAIVNWVIDLKQSKSSREKELISELRTLKTDLAGISMMDEFAKHAKLQRKIIKTQEELKTAANARSLNATKNKAIYTQIVNAVLGIYLIYLVWNFKFDPVLIIPEGWLYPLEGILSWPTGQPGAISVAVWLTLSRTSIRVLSSLK